MGREGGIVVLPMARVRLEATPSALTVALEGEGGDALARARDMIDAHLKRFAFREGFERMDWQESAADASRLGEAPAGEAAP